MTAETTVEEGEYSDAHTHFNEEVQQFAELSKDER